MLGKIEGITRRGWQRARWLDGITDSMDMSLTTSGRWWRTGKPGVLQSMRLQRARHNLVTRQQQQHNIGGLHEKAQAKFLAWWLMSCKHSNNLMPMLLLIILITKTKLLLWGFPGGSDSKESACNAGDLGSIPGLGRFSGEGNGYPFQYSCLKNSMDKGVWWATVHGVTKSRTWLSD